MQLLGLLRLLHDALSGAEVVTRTTSADISLPEPVLAALRREHAERRGSGNSSFDSESAVSLMTKLIEEQRYTGSAMAIEVEKRLARAPERLSPRPKRRERTQVNRLCCIGPPDAISQNSFLCFCDPTLISCTSIKFATKAP
eukprot:1998250-Pleurochrysis_carterae.AAC.1